MLGSAVGLLRATESIRNFRAYEEKKKCQFWLYGGQLSITRKRLEITF